MKKWSCGLLAALLLVQLCCLTACRRPTETEELDPASAAAERAVQDSLEILHSTLDSPDAAVDPDTLQVTSVQTYGDENIVRYTQTWHGVEVYGSSMVTVDGEEPYFAGTCYDLSEAFGPDFDALTAQATTLPTWLESSEALTVDTDSVHPVVYVTPEGEAAVATCFRFTAADEAGEPAEYEMVADFADSILYEVEQVVELQSFSPARLRAPAGTRDAIYLDLCDVSEYKGKYYAYNEEFNVFVSNDVRENLKEDQLKKIVKNHRDGSKMLIRLDRDKMYRFRTQDLSDPTDLEVAGILTVYCDVAAWYRDTFAYEGLNGKKDPVLLVYESKKKQWKASLATNLSGIAFDVRPEVVDAPEILAHEFCHSVFSTLTGTGKTKNETAALNEGIADVFAALYMADRGDDSWVLAQTLVGNTKDIPGTERTMDDYMYNYGTSFNPGINPIDWALFLSDAAGSILNSWRVQSTYRGISTQQSHKNAYIISHPLYEMWDTVFERDTEEFEQVLFRSIHYMPADPTFSNFRDAFLLAASRQHLSDFVSDLSKIFASAGINTASDAEFQKVKQKAEKDPEPTAPPVPEVQQMDPDNIMFPFAFNGLVFPLVAEWQYFCVVIPGDEYIELYDFDNWLNYDLGRLVTIRLYPEGEDYSYLPSFEKLGTLTAPDGSRKDVVAIYPTDNQVMIPESYNEKKMGLSFLLYSITAADGYTLER